MNDLKICFFGDFSLSLGDKRICEATEKGSKQWRLIKYLILSRTRSVEKRELIDAVFGYGAYSQRPSEALNALNATVHRARLLLSKISDNAPDIISYSNGSYKAVLPAGCEIDSDLFDILSEKVLLSSNFEEIKSYALKICEIYRGFFLGDGFSEEWARLLAEKYHTRYKRIFSILCGILRREGDFERICTLCEGASAIDPVCEEFRLERVRALFESGKKARAHGAYCEIASFFESVLSVPLSEEFRELGGKVISQDGDTLAMARRISEKNARAIIVPSELFEEYSSFFTSENTRSDTPVQTCLAEILFDGSISAREAILTLKQSPPASARRIILSLSKDEKKIYMLLEASAALSSEISDGIKEAIGKKHCKIRTVRV